jgi:hypothetical protein
MVIGKGKKYLPGAILTAKIDENAKSLLSDI